MGNKPINTDKWRKWLKSKGLVQKRITGHEIWDYPDPSMLGRPVTFRCPYKEIPAFHIRTNLKTLGIEYEIFKKELDNL